MAKMKKLTKREAEAVFAETEGTFEVIESVESCRNWVFNPRYPVQKFIGRILGRERGETKAKWRMWLEDEMDDRPDYINALEAAWLHDPEEVGPVTIAELPDGSIDIGDGWHRIAIAVVNDMKTVPAIVGMACKA